mgnify:FL=1
MFEFPIIVDIFFVSFLVACLIQFLLLFTIQGRVMARCKKKNKEGDMPDDVKPGVSVIVYAHNQGEALRRNLPSLLDNDYPNFEVIVVDDTSCDNTQDVLTIMEQRNDNIFHTKLTDKVRTMSHRKLALLLGVKAAHNEIILTTKAQCVPVSKIWISKMARNFTSKVDFVIGPMVFEGRLGLNSRFCQYDLFQRMVNMFGVTMSYCAFSGWSDNMAFRKHLLFEDNNKAFSGHLHIHPGEDDLFINAVAKHARVAVECCHESMVVRQETPLRPAWKKDRQNRAFTAKFSKLFPKIIKLTDYLTRYLCVGLGLALIIWCVVHLMWIPLSIVGILLLLRIVLVSLFSYFTAKELRIHRYMFSPIVYDLLIPLVDLRFWLSVSMVNKGFYVSKV